VGLFEKAAGCRGGAPLCLFLKSLKNIVKLLFFSLEVDLLEIHPPEGAPVFYGSF
jgi:hypothetical protein